VTRLLPVLAALAAMLAFAPAASAAPLTFSVDSAADDPDDPTTPLLCDNTGPDPTKCTLRSAIQNANANSGADTITFTGPGRSPAPATALPPVTDRVQIDGSGGTTTVTFGPAAAGPLLKLNAPSTPDPGAADSTVRAITFKGGASGPVIQIDALRVRLDTVTVRDAPQTGIRVNAADARLDVPTVTNVSGQGIVITGARATVATPEVFANGSDGIYVSGDGANISNGRVHDNTGTGVVLAGQSDIVSKVKLFANRDKPLALSAGANGNIASPQHGRSGPRRADGSLPLTGTTSGGSIELWQGNPASVAEPSFLAGFGVPAGDFSYSFNSEPQPGAEFSLNLTGGGTSEFTSVTVPPDVVSPDIGRSRALSTSEVRVEPNERLDPASVQKEDFTLQMAGQPRPITSATAAPDGSYVTLTSSGWKAGEAGYVELTGAGALNDAAGNATLAATRLRVAAAPGDFIAPLGGSLRVSPKKVCLTHGRGCPTTGMTISFVTTEPGKARVVIQRGNKRVGTRLYSGITAGPNTLKFNGRLGGRKLRAGRYRLLLFVQDPVGNVTDQPPITLFDIRRVTK
jgi:hypothetical protein